MSMKPYKTLLRAASDEFVVNKSRFIGHGCPCETEEAALAFLAGIRARHKDATHNCYAYIVGANMGIMRYSDDGEPGGTAGMPIIEVMKARGVTNCAVVVTRYFGGILLGAGGLVRAYSQGAAAALNACGVGVMHPTARYLLEVPYPMLGRLEFFLKTEPVSRGKAICRRGHPDAGRAHVRRGSLRRPPDQHVRDGWSRCAARSSTAHGRKKDNRDEDMRGPSS